MTISYGAVTITRDRPSLEERTQRREHAKELLERAADLNCDTYVSRTEFRTFYTSATGREFSRDFPRDFEYHEDGGVFQFRIYDGYHGMAVYSDGRITLSTELAERLAATRPDACTFRLDQEDQ